MADKAQINTDPHVPENVVVPSLQELMKECYQAIVNMQPDDPSSFIQGFYIGFYRGLNKPIHPYVALNIECGRLDRLVDDGIRG